MQGFPPPPEQRVTLANWQLPPFNRWAFQHVREVVPTARVARGPGPAQPLVAHAHHLDDIPVACTDGVVRPVAEVVGRTYTDGILVLHARHLLLEQYANAMRPDTPHLLMSVTKSLVGCVVGILADRGLLAVDAPVTHYVPELSRSGYDGATVRHLFDMRSGITFSEDYTSPDAEVRVLEEAIGWRPRRDPDVPHSMYEYLLTLGKGGEHGGPFQYRSCETDALGWVCERVAGRRMPALLSELVWQPIGAEHDADFTVDPAGAPMHDGGLCATLRDLARFGQMLLDHGTVDGREVVPAWWIRDSYTGGPDSREAFAASPTDTRMPGGMYRNQFGLPDADRALLLCLGIHGQMVYVNPAAHMVGVKLSTWPTPQDAELIFDTLRMFDAVAHHLA